MQSEQQIPDTYEGHDACRLQGYIMQAHSEAAILEDLSKHRNPHILRLRAWEFFPSPHRGKSYVLTVTDLCEGSLRKVRKRQIVLVEWRSCVMLKTWILFEVT